MQAFVLLLRGINVGGKNKVPMAPLVTLLQEKGFVNVKSYIQSGNLVFQCAQTPNAQEVEHWIQEVFDVRAQALVLDAARFASLAEANPYREQEGKLAHLYFCFSTPQWDEVKQAQWQTEKEVCTLNQDCLYLFAPDGIGRSRLVANIEAVLGVSATGRNLNTVNKLQAMLTALPQ